jgi:hypothetical protein
MGLRRRSRLRPYAIGSGPLKEARVTRTPTLSLLALGVLLGACAAENAADPSGGSENTGGASAGSGGAGGTRPAGGGGVGGGPTAGGSGGSAGAGGAVTATGGSGGTASADAPAATGGTSGAPGADAAGADAPAGADAAPPSSGASDGGFKGIVPDGAPWQMMCPPTASRADCCSLYCSCMTSHCPATMPKDCQAACVDAKNWDLVCRTYQCFASFNPNFPQDHDSHCRHAIGLQGKCGNK